MCLDCAESIGVENKGHVLLNYATRTMLDLARWYCLDLASPT